VAVALREVMAVPRKAPHQKAPDPEYGRKIADLRDLSGLTQEKLAARLGLKKEGYRMYEKGYSRVGPGKVELWAKALDMPVRKVAEALDIKLFTTSAESCLSRELIALLPPEIAASAEDALRTIVDLPAPVQAQAVESLQNYLAGYLARRNRPDRPDRT
jgi:transcriptional regulator with XRE-family HTH domain